MPHVMPQARGEATQDNCDLFCILPIVLKPLRLRRWTLKSGRSELKPELGQDPKLSEP